MRIGIVTERSTAARNIDIVNALKGMGHELINVGMQSEEDPPLLFTHAGMVAALLLNYNLADFVVGGCGNGQGFMNVAMQFPNVFCGVIRNEIDGWLFAQINGGNCVSLVLGQEYGFASDAKLRFILERLFSVEIGSGYPKERKEPQNKLRADLMAISAVSHVSMDECLKKLDKDFVKTCVNYPNFKNVFEKAAINADLKNYLASL